MPATGHDIHIDVPLSNVALNYRPSGMIADLICPVVPVPKQSNMYPIWSQADAFRVVDDTRAPGTEANRIHRSVSSDTYFCMGRALKMGITLEDMENADEGYINTLREGRTTYILDKLALGWEKRVALLCTSGSNVGSYTVTASAWTGTGADPATDVLNKIHMVQDISGYRPNRIVMGGKAWRSFRKHSAVQNLIWGSAGGNPPSRLLSREQAAALFEVDQVLVGDAYYNTAGGQLTMSLASLWNDHVWIGYVAPTPSIEVPSALYTFRWSRPGIPNLQVERHPYDTKRKVEEIEAGYYQDEKKVSSALMALLLSVNSSG
jgi:hypothetical protein